MTKSNPQILLCLLLCFRLQQRKVRLVFFELPLYAVTMYACCKTALNFHHFCPNDMKAFCGTKLARLTISTGQPYDRSLVRAIQSAAHTARGLRV